MNNNLKLFIVFLLCSMFSGMHANGAVEQELSQILRRFLGVSETYEVKPWTSWIDDIKAVLAKNLNYYKDLHAKLERMKKYTFATGVASGLENFKDKLPQDIIQLKNSMTKNQVIAIIDKRMKGQ